MKTIPAAATIQTSGCATRSLRRPLGSRRNLELVGLAVAQIVYAVLQTGLDNRPFEVFERGLESGVIVVVDGNRGPRPDYPDRLDALVAVHGHQNAENPRPAQVHQPQVDLGVAAGYLPEAIVDEGVPADVEAQPRLAVRLLELEHAAHHRW